MRAFKLYVFDLIRYPYDGANEDLVPKKSPKQTVFDEVKLDTQTL